MRATAPLSALLGAVAVLAAGCAGLAGGPAATRTPAPVEPPTDAVECAQPPTTGSYPYPGGPGATEQPHLLPDAWLVGLDNSDRVQQLPGDLLIVQRDGSSIAALQLEPADDGSWWIAAYAACGDLGIELDWPPAPIPTDVPDLAELECDDTSTRVLTPFVRARADGVHLHFRNTGSTWIGYAHPYGGGGARDGGEETTTWQIPPGRIPLSCANLEDPSLDTGEVPHTAHLTVLAPDGTLPLQPEPAEISEPPDECAPEIDYHGNRYSRNGVQVTPAPGPALPDPAHPTCPPTAANQPIEVHQLPGVPPDTAILVITNDDVALYLRNDADFDHLPAALDQLFHAPTCQPTDQPIQLTARWNGITGIEDETAPIPEPPYTLLVHVTNSTPTRYERADLELTVPTTAGHPIRRDDIFDHLYTGDTLTTTVACASDGGFLVKQLSFRPAETETATP